MIAPKKTVTTPPNISMSGKSAMGLSRFRYVVPVPVPPQGVQGQLGQLLEWVEVPNGGEGC